MSAKVVSRGIDSDCAAGVCLRFCSHLMWKCNSCKCEGGWGAEKEKLEVLAAQHRCDPLTLPPRDFDRWLQQHDAEIAKATEERIIKLLESQKCPCYCEVHMVLNPAIERIKGEQK